MRSGIGGRIRILMPYFRQMHPRRCFMNIMLFMELRREGSPSREPLPRERQECQRKEHRLREQQGCQQKEHRPRERKEFQPKENLLLRLREE